jgi:hypothetical protein
MEYHDPLNAGLVLPFQRPRDGRSTLPVLPSLPLLVSGCPGSSVISGDARFSVVLKKVSHL